MKLAAKGFLLFGLYILLVTAPLAVAALAFPRGGSAWPAVNVAAGLGYVALAAMALEMALVSRTDAASGAFGLDVLFQFHRGMGIAAVALVLLHPLLLVAWGPYPAAVLSPFASMPAALRYGSGAALCALALAATSLLRRRLGMHYEVWRILHGLLALGAVVLAALHVWALGRSSQGLAMHLLGGLFLAICVGVFLRNRLVRPFLLLGKPWEVLENRSEPGGARTIRIHPLGHPGFAFQPGQFAWINLGATPFHLEQHPVSMSSCGDLHDGGELAFTIRALGDWSGRSVPALVPGRRVWIEGPYGGFSIDRHEGPGFVLIAGGVGITPFCSILSTMAFREDRRPVVLFMGARSEADLTLRPTLEFLVSRMDLKIVYVLEHPPERWQGERGYIDAAVLGRHLPKNHLRFQFFVCGPPPLMDLMETELPALGVAADRIHAERFDIV